MVTYLMSLMQTIPVVPGVCGANLPMQHTVGDEYPWASKGWQASFLRDVTRYKKFPLTRTVLLVGLGNPCSRTVSWQIHLLIISTLDICLKT